VHGNTIAKPWARMRSRAGLDDVTMHDLRHFYASGLIAEGCDVVTVQRSVGHRSASTTLDVYAHLWPTAEDRTRRAAGVLFTVVAGSAADSPRTRHGVTGR
jgi:integrase